jgi:hypothetical protein
VQYSHEFPGRKLFHDFLIKKEKEKEQRKGEEVKKKRHSWLLLHVAKDVNSVQIAKHC